MPWVAINHWDPDERRVIVVSPPEHWNRVKSEIIASNPPYSIMLISPLDPPMMVYGIKAYRYETRYCPYRDLKKMIDSGLQAKLELITHGKTTTKEGEIIYATDTDDQVS